MAHSHVYSWSISRIWKENTSFRNGNSKEELLRKIRKFRPGKSKQYRLRNGALRANCGFIKRRDGGRLKINVWSANLFGKVEVLQGIQHTNNYSLIVDLYWNAFLIDRFFVFRTVIAKFWKTCTARPDKLTRKLTCNSFKSLLRPIQKLMWINFSFERAFCLFYIVFSLMKCDLCVILHKQTDVLESGSNSPMWHEDQNFIGI